MGRCFSCFKEYGDEFEVCPYCGAVRSEKTAEPVYLSPGTLLWNRYLLGDAIGAGGFGVIYRAWDTKLDTVIAVKEFFANRLMTRAVGENKVIVNKKSVQEFEYRKERFLAEARTMAKFGNHRNIPNVFESFEENGTAYIVMELLSGLPLSDYLKQNGRIDDRDFAIEIANEVGKALISLHEAGIIHRDVAPDNIFICEGDEIRVKLLDLGAAKLADNTDKVIDIILKPGYSPVEQYDSTASIGTWTDIYALGATLYVMLTGEKPDESTNRKISDSLLSPHEIDPSIPVNLSNAVMKAMAVNRHLRFKTVEDFLKAINGEKKIISLKKEKRLRAGKRLAGIVAACLVLVLTAGMVVNVYANKKKEQGLPDAEISVWIAIKKGSSETEATKSVLDDFTEKFPNIKVIVTAIPEILYKVKLENAAANHTLPTLFESSGASDEVLSEATDVTNVLNSEQAQTCLFLDQYDQYYTAKKQVPLAVEAPAAYLINSGSTSVDYTEPTFTDTDAFGAEKIAVDSDCEELIHSNLSVSDPIDPELFYDKKENECAVLLSSNMAMNKVRKSLTGYEKSVSWYAGDTVYCHFDYEWSIGQGTESEIKAAERLLSWMLGNNYQNMLMISKNSEGQIPVNGECFNAKLEQKNYAPIKDIYKHYYFVR